DGKPQSKDWMSISRYSETEYLIRYNGEKGSVDYRGYPIRVAGVSCIQIQAKPKKGNGRYYVFSYELLNGDLLIKGLNPSLVSNELKSISQMRRAFFRHKDNKDLFIHSGRFRRISKEQIDAEISALDKELSAVGKKKSAVDKKISAIDKRISDVDIETNALEKKKGALERENSALKVMLLLLKSSDEHRTNLVLRV
ncbi:MAG TPA: hypothetical protein VIG62_21575, partial [Blastocatellia bacterium]